MKKYIFLTIFFYYTLYANTFFASKPQDRIVTIYDNIAFMQEKRDVEIGRSGINDIVCEDLPESIIPASATADFSDGKIDRLTQIFQQGTNLNFNRLATCYKKHRLKINFFKPTEKTGDRVIAQGYIVSLEGSFAAIEDISGEIFKVSTKDIFFDKIPKALKEKKASLIWRVKANRGKKELDLSYLVKNLRWSANYILKLGNKSSLEGWINIKNNSDTEYKNCKIYCMAGSVNVNERRVRVLQKASFSVQSDAVPPEIESKAFGGYHIYKIPFKANIPKGMEQLRFLSAKNINYKEFAKGGFYLSLYPARRQREFTLSHIVTIKNSKNNSLGKALPKGKIRVFKKDKEGILHFVGENNINDKTANDDIELNIGKFFDIKAKINQIYYKASKNRRFVHTKIEITLYNKDIKQREILFKNRYPIEGRYEISSTCKGICKEKNISAREVLYTMKLKAKEKYKFFVEYKLND